MTRQRVAPFVWGFVAYAWLATTLSAAWFIRRTFPSTGLLESLMWQGSVYALWLPVAGLVWLLLARLSGVRRLTALAAVAVPIVPLIAFASTLVDLSFRDLSLSLWSEAALERGPVAILLYTALAAVGLAASEAQTALDARALNQRLEAALAQARETPTTSAPPLMVSVGPRRVPVVLEDVEAFTAAANYVLVHWSGREGLMRQTLSALEADLDGRFVRAHRSALVNLAKVAAAQPLSDGSWRLTLESGQEVVLSRTHRDAVLTRLGR